MACINTFAESERDRLEALRGDQPQMTEQEIRWAIRDKLGAEFYWDKLTAIVESSEDNQDKLLHLRMSEKFTNNHAERKDLHEHIGRLICQMDDDYYRPQVDK